MLFAAVAAMSMAIAMPAQAQSRKDKKAAEKANWELQQQQQREEAELRHKLRMDSIANAQKKAEAAAAAEEKARREAAAQAAAEKQKAEQDAKKTRKPVKAPCKGVEYNTSESKLRAWASREGLDMDAAQQGALVSARTKLAGMIETSIQSLASDYLKETGKNKSKTQERKLESLTMQSIDRAIQIAYPICEEYEEYTDNEDQDVFICYIVIEIDREAALKSLHKNICEQENDVIQSDYEQFKQEFKEHFSKEEKKALDEAE
jgi:hypothetical protein